MESTAVPSLWESMCQPLWRCLAHRERQEGKSDPWLPQGHSVTSAKLPREQDFPACWALLIQALCHSVAASYPRGKWFTGKQILPAG